LKAADAAMDRAKRSGRNNVQLYDAASEPDRASLRAADLQHASAP
jgi:hypothetical protein